jgi:hypothetical protein
MHELNPARFPDLSARPFDLQVRHSSAHLPADLYRAWTIGFDTWFAAPGSVQMIAAAGAPFYFETEFRPEQAAAVQRHPHYGRFLRLIENQLVQLTWVTGLMGTEGAETVVSVDFEANDNGTLLQLSHAGFANAASRDRHAQAWPLVLGQMEQKLQSSR